jgi:hypothetical protein
MIDLNKTQQTRIKNGYNQLYKFEYKRFLFFVVIFFKNSYLILFKRLMLCYFLRFYLFGANFQLQNFDYCTIQYYTLTSNK